MQIGGDRGHMIQQLKGKAANQAPQSQQANARMRPVEAAARAGGLAGGAAGAINQMQRPQSSASGALGAGAFARGTNVAFGGAHAGAGLHTAAHEAAHVVQQRGANVQAQQGDFTKRKGK